MNSMGKGLDGEEVITETSSKKHNNNNNNNNNNMKIITMTFLEGVTGEEVHGMW